MKIYFSAVFLFAWLFSVSCGGASLAGDSRYILELPSLPQAWEAILGEPYWRLEWFDADGRKRSALLSGEGGLEIALPGTMANPVLALPFWPGKGIGPGVFMPAGAVFPFDVSGKRLVLSWQGGVDANLFMELARSANGGLAPSGNAALRLPWNFNWPRFRRLFEDPALNDEVRADPWLADWPDIAARTLQSGFDRRRLVPEARSGLEIPLGRGPWIGTSPFAAPMAFDANPVFQVRASPRALDGAAADTWVSAEGLLRVNTEAWLWREFPLAP